MNEQIPFQAPGMPGRLKSGLVFALVGFVVGLILGYLANVCTLPVSALLGAAAGWVAARWEVPATAAEARRVGLLAGLLAGVGAALGSVTGALLSAISSGPTVIEWMGEQMGALPPPSLFWGSVVVTVSCLAGLGLAAEVAFGLLGGLAWHERRSSGQVLDAQAEVRSELHGPGRTALLWMGGLLALLICCVAGMILISMLTLFGMEGGGVGGFNL